MNKGKKTSCKKLKKWFSKKRTQKFVKTLKRKLKKQIQRRRTLAHSVRKVCKK